MDGFVFNRSEYYERMQILYDADMPLDYNSRSMLSLFIAMEERQILEKARRRVGTTASQVSVIIPL